MKINWGTWVLGAITMSLLGLIFMHFYKTTNDVSGLSLKESLDYIVSGDTEGNESNLEDDSPKEDSFIVAVFGTDERNDEKSRTDTIILIRYDGFANKVTFVSIPRDSLVDIPGKHKDKINAAHAYGGIPLAIETIENLMDIKIDYYASTNFNGFKEAIDIIGGVEVNAKKDIHYKGVYIPAGNQVLDSEELLIYVRFRGDSEGDFGRIERQQEVLISIAKELIRPKNLHKLPRLMSVASEHVNTDINIKEFADILWDLKDFSNLSVENYTLETTSKKMNGIWYEIINEEDLISKSRLLNGLEPLQEEIEEENSEFDNYKETNDYEDSYSHYEVNSSNNTINGVFFNENLYSFHLR